MKGGNFLLALAHSPPTQPLDLGFRERHCGSGAAGSEVGREHLLTVNTAAIESSDPVWPPDFRTPTYTTPPMLLPSISPAV